MFLKSDYALMLDNEERMTSEAEQFAAQYEAQTSRETEAGVSHYTQQQGLLHRETAALHREMARHWADVILNQEKETHRANLASSR